MISKLALDKINKSSNTVDGFIEVLNALVEDQTIDARTAGVVRNALIYHRGALDPAIRANLSNKPVGDKDNPDAAPIIRGDVSNDPGADQRGVRGAVSDHRTVNDPGTMGFDSRRDVNDPRTVIPNPQPEVDPRSGAVAPGLRPGPGGGTGS